LHNTTPPFLGHLIPSHKDVEDLVDGKNSSSAIRLRSCSCCFLPWKDADDSPQKQKQQQDANADAAAGTKRKKVTAAQLRVQKGMFHLVALASALATSR